jgi:hypothetical protein
MSRTFFNTMKDNRLVNVRIFETIGSFESGQGRLWPKIRSLL